MALSGMGGTNYILMSSAKLRVEAEIITEAKIVGSKGHYILQFTNKEAEWKGEPLVLCSSRFPHEAKIFKSIDGAASDVLRTGLKVAALQIGE